MIQEDISNLRVSRLREPTYENIMQDVELFEAGILDRDSLLDGYKFHRDGVAEVTVRDKFGNIKQIRRSHNIRTNVGASVMAIRVASVQGPPANYVGITSNFATVNSTDTTLVGEYSASGLQRAAATFAQNAPVASASLSQSGTLTLNIVFTYTGSGAQNISKIGIFDAVSAGNMWFEILINTASVNSNGDNVTITYTLTF